MAVSQVEALNSKALKNLQKKVSFIHFNMAPHRLVIIHESLSVSGTFSALFLSQAENIIHVMYINFSFLALSHIFTGRMGN